MRLGMCALEEELGLEALAHQSALHLDLRHQDGVDGPVGDGARKLAQRQSARHDGPLPLSLRLLPPTLVERPEGGKCRSDGPLAVFAKTGPKVYIATMTSGEPALDEF